MVDDYGWGEIADPDVPVAPPPQQRTAFWKKFGTRTEYHYGTITQTDGCLGTINFSELNFHLTPEDCVNSDTALSCDTVFLRIMRLIDVRISATAPYFSFKMYGRLNDPAFSRAGVDVLATGTAHLKFHDVLHDIACYGNTGRSMNGPFGKVYQFMATFECSPFSECGF